MTFIANKKQNAIAIVIGLIATILMIHTAIVASSKTNIVTLDPNFEIDFGIITSPKIASNDPAEYNNPIYDSGIN